jgi:hypothetical protein
MSGSGVNADAAKIYNAGPQITKVRQFSSDMKNISGKCLK